mmetsp:Transcript_23167/g.68265  ORF Transcript_23167/g.68265 Transcript_23167/m.68265 type:complete len:125 (+) Transcript_23167:34-408(+)
MATARGFVARSLLFTSRRLSAPASKPVTLHFTQKLLIIPEASGPSGEKPPHEKVSMKVSVDELGLTPPQLDRLAQVAGSRFDASTRTLRLVSAVHEHAEANKVVIREQLKLLIDDCLDNAEASA